MSMIVCVDSGIVESAFVPQYPTGIITSMERPTNQKKRTSFVGSRNPISSYPRQSSYQRQSSYPPPSYPQYSLHVNDSVQNNDHHHDVAPLKIRHVNSTPSSHAPDVVNVSPSTSVFSSIFSFFDCFRRSRAEDKAPRMFTEIPRRISRIPKSVPELSAVDLRESNWLLDPLPPHHLKKPTLVLDLDETLVHSSFQESEYADFTIRVELEGTVHEVFVVKRPGVDEFLYKACQKWEIILFTASLSVYAEPLIKILDPHGCISAVLYREACVPFYGTYVKDLSKLGRIMSRTVLIDNSPHSYIFQPRNSVEISSFYEDSEDRELHHLIVLLNDHLVNLEDVRTRLDAPTKPLEVLLFESRALDQLPGSPLMHRV
uniref:Nuclear LIM factor interactor-interacting protein spore-specific form n=1 Tax=Hirondellea gigas TaxID=1518452 RepID=A0A6A7G6E5_9CRUS